MKSAPRRELQAKHELRVSTAKNEARLKCVSDDRILAYGPNPTVIGLVQKLDLVKLKATGDVHRCEHEVGSRPFAARYVQSSDVDEVNMRLSVREKADFTLRFRRIDGKKFLRPFGRSHDV